MLLIEVDITKVFSSGLKIHRYNTVFKQLFKYKKITILQFKFLIFLVSIKSKRLRTVLYVKLHECVFQVPKLLGHNNNRLGWKYIFL